MQTTQPLLITFMKELAPYCKSAKYVEKKAATKPKNIISAFNLFDETFPFFFIIIS